MNITTAIEIVAQMIQHNLNLPEDASNSAYLIPMLWSLPGEGKTTAVEDLAKSMNMDLRTVIIAQYDAGELGGFPAIDRENEQYVRYAPFFMKGFSEDRPTILFLDEMPQAGMANLNVCAQLSNERRIGEHRLPRSVVIVCAGNPMSARAGTTQLPSHLKDRLTHLDIQTDHEAFRSYALANDFAPEITSFINDRAEFLQKFDPNQNASPSPRSWERVNSILSLNMSPEQTRGALIGQIGEAAVTDFFGYMRMFNELPDVINVIFPDPENAPIPEAPDVLYALCSNIAYKVKEETAEAMIKYVKRFRNKEFAAFCVREAITRNKALKKNKAVSGWVVTDGRDLLL